MTETPDPTALSLDDLRGLRQQLQLEDDAVSYARRVAQARLDMVKVEQVHRGDTAEGGAADDLRAVLSQHLTGGPARPPRPTVRFGRRGHISPRRRNATPTGGWLPGWSIPCGSAFSAPN